MIYGAIAARLPVLESRALAYNNKMSKITTHITHSAARAQTHDTEKLIVAGQSQLLARVDAYRAAPLPHFRLAQPRASDAEETARASAWAARFARIVILGTGGSSLGGQVLAQIQDWGTPAARPAGPELIFADNLDAQSFADMIAPEHLEYTGFLIISKSGGTPETLMQTVIALDALVQASHAPADHALAIAGRGDNLLRQLASTHGFVALDHDDEIGGRFSVFTNVGMLPARVAGVDIAALRGGAQASIDALFVEPHAHPALIGAACQVAHMSAGRNISVLMGYADRLQRLGLWYRQLWAESLGKQGRGSVPVNALGPVDQHSQTQLYVEGPDDKFYTFVTLAGGGGGPVAPEAMLRGTGLAYLAGRSMGALNAAEARATMDTLAGLGRPLRHFELAAVDAAAMGELLMMFMLETILAADLMGVNAFDQPGVEHAKILTKEYLQQG